MLGQRTVTYFLNLKHTEIFTSSAEEDSFFPDVDYKQVDITKREQVKQAIYDFCPDYIVNAAAFTAVDKCETEKELSWKVNVKAVEYMAEACRVIDAHLIHVSSDYVFDGKKGNYIENDKPNPISYYGRTKLASENALTISGTIHTVIRTNVLYGLVNHGRPDFVRWVVNSLRAEKPIRIVTDQVNNPTFIDDLASAISSIVEFKKEGLYHIGGKEFLNRFEFTMRIAEVFGLDKNLVSPIITEELHQPAKRPLKSGLVTIKAQTEFNYQPHDLTDSLEKMKKLIG